MKIYANKGNDTMTTSKLISIMNSWLELISRSGDYPKATLSDLKASISYVMNKLEKSGISASSGTGSKRRIMAGESYGWVVDANEAYEAYEFACEYFGKEQLDADIVDCLSSDELADNLAYIFRMNDFEEWYDRNGSDEDDE